MPTEEVVVGLRMHPASLWRPAILVLAGLLVVAFVTSTGLGGGVFVELIWILWALLFLWGCWRVVNWRFRYFVVTENRIMLVTGVFDKDVAMLPLTKVTDMRLNQSVPGRVFRYAEFIVESAGQEQALRRVPFVPYPRFLYQEILALIFPPKSAPPPTEKDPGF